MRFDNRVGIALLEVIVALAILAIAGGWALAMASQSLAAVHQAQQADALIGRASAFLDAVALWPRDDLDRHLGTHEEGAWLLRVERLEPTLYEITIDETLNRDLNGTSSRALLRTVLFRVEPPDVAH